MADENLIPVNGPRLHLVAPGEARKINVGFNTSPRMHDLYKVSTLYSLTLDRGLDRS